MFTPSGYWLIVRQEVGATIWLVRVLDFATWAHRRYEFATEAQARTEAARWLI